MAPALLCALEISIHALCEEGDKERLVLAIDFEGFLSTPSARRATAVFLLGVAGEHISIHALCEEGDLHEELELDLNNNFYPRPLRGGRRDHQGRGRWRRIFLSTPSARRATSSSCQPCSNRSISIHALCEEGDPTQPKRTMRPTNFYPRPLRGGRPLCVSPYSSRLRFLSTPSARRATGKIASTSGCIAISIHALCEEGDVAIETEMQMNNISIHALCEEGDP